MIKVKFFGTSSDWELVDLMRMEIEESFLGPHPNAVSEGVDYLSGNSFELSFTGAWNSPDEIDKETIKSICKYHEVDCAIFLGSDAIEIFNSESGQKANSQKEEISDISEKNNKNDIKEFIDKNQVGILSYDNWVMDVKRDNKSKRGAIGVSLILSLLTILYIGVYGFDFFAIIGIIAALFFLTPLMIKDKELTTEAYEVYIQETRSKHAEVKERRAEIQKNVVELEEKKKKEIEEKKKPYFKKIETIEANLDALKSVELFSVGKFKSSISELERQILEKSNPETLQKFVRIGKFLNEVESHLNAMRSSMIEDLMSTNLRSQVLYELQKSPKGRKTELDYVLENQENSLKRLEGKKFVDIGSYWSELERLDKLMNLVSKNSKSAIGAFRNESKDLNYLENMAISMLVFLIEGRNVLYFEIIEFFDGLGALDSSWEKNIKVSLKGIKISLDNLNDSITGLGDSINKMTAQNDMILKELSNIDSTIKFGNLIQSITAYNTYRIKKKLNSDK
jgi:small nuclear ribonucleoprotein (snRNP)-like protein